MLLILAHEFDYAASHAIGQCPAGAALVARPSDFCRPGWVLGNDPLAWIIRAGDRTVRASQVDAMVNCLSIVMPAELVLMAENEREYTAGELSALLTWMLTAFPRPVFNRPSATALQGPGWNARRWAAECAALGVRCDVVADRVVAGAVGGEPDARTATWLLDEIVEADDEFVGSVAAALSRASGASYLKVWVAAGTGVPRLRQLSLNPDLECPSVLRKLSAFMTPETTS